MDLSQLTPGDVVYAASAIHNDGGIPDLDGGALVADAGTRGVIVNIGHLEEDPLRAIYLVRFEGEGLALGAPDRLLAGGTAGGGRTGSRSLTQVPTSTRLPWLGLCRVA